LAPENDEARMSIGEHLEELRRRVFRSLIYLVLAFVVVLIFNDRIMAFIISQPLEVLRDLGQQPRMIYLSPTEGFFTWLKLALVASVIVASPLMAREIWGFIAAGLYPHERKYVEIFGPISFALFLAGVAFLYFAVMPVALTFLFDFGKFSWIPGFEDPGQVVENLPQVSEYLSLYIMMSLIMGVVFQLPLVMLFFMATGILSPKFFGKYRRHFIVGAVAVLAIVSPTGDAATLILISLPVVLLYEVGILMGRMVGKKKREAAE
jgi:Tat protein translocase TatC